jgi:NitT/TauT family transport system permease protein
MARPDLRAPSEESEALSIEDVEASVQRARASSMARRRVSAVVYPIAAVVLLLAIWEAATWMFQVPAFLVPPPSAVAEVLHGKFDMLLSHGWVTSVEVALGFLLSVAIGVPLALAIFLWPTFARTIYPLLVSSQAMPKVAIAPLFVVWFGFGLLPKVLISFLIAFFPVVISTVVGLGSIEPEKIHLARSLGLNGLTTFFKIRLPNAMPSIFGGLKIAITLAVVGAVVGEFVGGNAGLGYLLLVANGSLDTPLLFAGLVGLTALGVIFFMLIEAAERWAIPWHTSSRNSGARESM